MSKSLCLERTSIGQSRQQTDASAVVPAAVCKPVVIAQVSQVEDQVETDVKSIGCIPCHYKLDQLPLEGSCLRPAMTPSQLPVVLFCTLKGCPSPQSRFREIFDSV